MEDKLSLNEEIDIVLKKKLSVCQCNPCTCSEQTKDSYFQELNEILTRFNKENLSFDFTKDIYLGKDY
jgi:hypothetical protein